MNNRFFIAGCILLNTYSSISLLCLLLALYMGDTVFTYIPVHFFLSLLMIVFSLFWRKSYFKHQLYESGSAAVLYAWTMRMLVVTFVLYALLYLVFVAFLLLVPGLPDY